MTDEQVIKAIDCCIQHDANVCGNRPFCDKEEGCVDSDFKLLPYELVDVYIREMVDNLAKEMSEGSK